MTIRTEVQMLLLTKSNLTSYEVKKNGASVAAIIIIENQALLVDKVNNIPQFFHSIDCI